MYNILIWGTGRLYNQYFNLIKYYEEKKEISIIGVVSNDVEINNTIDGYTFYKKHHIKKLNFDYCIVAIKNFESIKEEATTLGIPIKKLIPVRAACRAVFGTWGFFRTMHGKTAPSC